MTTYEEKYEQARVVWPHGIVAATAADFIYAKYRFYARRMGGQSDFVWILKPEDAVHVPEGGLVHALPSWDKDRPDTEIDAIIVACNERNLFWQLTL